jgi:hypothetical protein
MLRDERIDDEEKKKMKRKDERTMSFVESIEF